MRLDAVLLTLLLSEASAAPRKKRDIGAVEHEHSNEHAHHAVSFFDSFFSFFGGGSDTSPKVYFELKIVECLKLYYSGSSSDI